MVYSLAFAAINRLKCISSFDKELFSRFRIQVKANPLFPINSKVWSCTWYHWKVWLDSVVDSELAPLLTATLDLVSSDLLMASRIVNVAPSISPFRLNFCHDRRTDASIQLSSGTVYAAAINAAKVRNHDQNISHITLHIPVYFYNNDKTQVYISRYENC